MILSLFHFISFSKCSFRLSQGAEASCRQPSPSCIGYSSSQKLSIRVSILRCQLVKIMKVKQGAKFHQETWGWEVVMEEQGMK